MVFWVGIVIAIGLAVGAAGVIFADTVITRAINEFGHRALNVEARVETCRISLLKGTLSLRGIELKNPAGFKAPRMVYIEHVSLALVPSTLFKDLVHVRRVEISGVELTYEAVGFGRSNLSVFLDGLKGRLRREGISLGRSGDEKAKNVVIDRLLVEGGRVSLSAVSSRGRGIIIPLPSMEIRDIGRHRPATVSEAVSEILRRLGQAALSSAGVGAATP